MSENHQKVPLLDFGSVATSQIARENTEQLPFSTERMLRPYQDLNLLSRRDAATSESILHSFGSQANSDSIASINQVGSPDMN